MVAITKALLFTAWSLVTEDEMIPNAAELVTFGVVAIVLTSASVRVLAPIPLARLMPEPFCCFGSLLEADCVNLPDVMVSTLVPRLDIWPSISALTPSPTPTITKTAKTPITTPTAVKADRSLADFMERKAFLIFCQIIS